MSLDDLEKELYKLRNKDKEIVSTDEETEDLKSAKEPLRLNWEDEGEDHGRGKFPRIAKRIFFIVAGALAFLAITIGVIFFILRYNGGARGVSIDVYGLDEIYRGVPFEITVQASNDIDTFLQDAQILINLTPGIISLDNLSNKNIVSDSMGDIGGGSLTKKTFRFLAVGDSRSIQKITVLFSYASDGKARFEVKKIKDIVIGESAISLDIQKPEQLMLGSKFDIQIDYKNNSSFDFPDVSLEIKYPPEFKFVSASLTPTSLNNYWKLGELKSNTKGGVQVKGELIGSDQLSVNIPVVVYVNFLGQQYQLDERFVGLTVSPSPINLHVLVNNQSDYISKIGDNLRYTIRYENKSGIGLADVVVRAGVVGELFDFTTLQTGGSFDSLASQIVWNASRVPELRILEPGASGEVSFTVKLVPFFSPKRSGDKNFILKINAQIDSPSVPYYLSADKTSAAASINTKVGGLLSIDAQALYRDAESGMVNAGKLPPRVNQPTQYTVHWVLRNYITDVQDVEIKSFLEAGVRMTGMVKSNIETVPLFNERTQEVIWKIDKIVATRGILSDPIEAIFQIEAVPNVTQIGREQPLLRKTTVEAIDGFTNIKLINADEPLTTSLIDDKTVGREEGRVAP